MISKQRVIAFLKLFYRGFGRYKRQIGILTFLGFFGSLLEGIGINALIPLFSFITGQGEGGNDFISKTIKSAFNFFHINFSIKYLLIFISLLFILKAVLVVLSNYIAVRINSGYEEQTRKHLFKDTLKANWPFLLKQKLGHLEILLMTNIRNNSVLLGYISIFTITIASLIVYAFVAINISFYITLIALASSVLLLSFYRPVVDRLRKLAYEEEAVNRQIAHHVNENIIGMKTVKTMAAEEQIDKISGDFFSRLRRIQIKSFLFSSLPGSLSEPFSLIFICVVFAFSYKTPNFNIAAFAAVIYLIKQIFAYGQQLSKYLLAFNSQVPYLRKVLDYQNEAILQKEENQGDRNFKFEGAIEFKDVNFYYEKGRDILDNINFKINKGETIGLVGPSGAGKTTIVDLFLRLFCPTQGKILLDDINIQDINLQEWRKNIGYVSQDIFLKNDTIANNIKFYNESISEKEIEEAAKMANIYDFIQSCPERFSTFVGERGILLSAGQRQRIIIARILARRPQFLILDEATSALDNESERQIQEVIENLKNRITVFVIAHRLTTLTNSDRLLALEKGKIVEQGKPSELLSDKESYFYRVYNIKK